MKPVDLGRKNYIFLGYEQAGQAVATYDKLVKSCKANKASQLKYITCLLENSRHKGAILLLPDECMMDTIA
jgi:hypothetical protein